MPPIACGPTSVTKAYCGATEISKGYCGSNLFFSSAPPTVPIPTRSSSAGAGDGTSGIIVGGWVGANNNDAYSYSIANNLVTSHLLTPTNAPAARYDHAMVGDATSGLLFGGTTTTAVGDLYTYSVSGGNITWTRQSATDAGRSGARIVGTPSSGLIFFGVNSSGSYQGSVRRYTRSGSTYSFSSVLNYGNVYGYQRRRSQFGIAGTTASGIIFGGRIPSSSGVSNSIYRYAATGNNLTWSRLTLSGTRPPARRQPGMVGTATSGIIFGGRSSSSARYGDAYSYSVSGNTITITPLTVVGTISARSSFVMLGSGTGGIVFSGSPSGTTGNLFQRYARSGSTITWTALQYAS